MLGLLKCVGMSALAVLGSALLLPLTHFSVALALGAFVLAVTSQVTLEHHREETRETHEE